MVYCWKCGEEIEDSDIYCCSCGTKQEKRTDDNDVEAKAEEFWRLIEGMIESEIERIDGNTDLVVSKPLLDRFTFSYQMYVIGLMKGRIGALLLTSGDESEGFDVQDADYSPVYEGIVDAVQEREEDIREALKESEQPKFNGEDL
jgi:hypothetical protein